MKSLYFLLFSFTLLCLFGACEIISPPSPHPEDVFIKYYGGNQDQEGVDLAQTEDDGFIILADTRSFATSSSSFGDKFSYLIKTDDLGNEIWSKKFPNEGDAIQGSRESKKIVITDDGYLILANLYPTPNQSKILLIKTDKSGEEMWSKVWRKDSTGIEIGLYISYNSRYFPFDRK